MSDSMQGGARRRPNPRVRPVAMERDERRLVIDWADGHRSEYALDDLRRACPCATCRNERESAPAASPLRVLPATAPERALLADVSWVGWYAFRLTWEDGHDTGLYSLEYLRDLCPCATCGAAGAPG
ncbi:MAG TPA: DUF971 domain-containing protein [Gemmatimonadota bacterium]